MKVNVYSKNGVLLKEFGEDPYRRCSDGARTVSECLRMNESLTKLTFDDGLYPKTSFIYGEVIMVTY
jgi:hypothetical protein